MVCPLSGFNGVGVKDGVKVGSGKSIRKVTSTGRFVGHLVLVGISILVCDGKVTVDSRCFWLTVLHAPNHVASKTNTSVDLLLRTIKAPIT